MKDIRLTNFDDETTDIFKEEFNQFFTSDLEK